MWEILFTIKVIHKDGTVIFRPVPDPYLLIDDYLDEVMETLPCRSPENWDGMSVKSVLYLLRKTMDMIITESMACHYNQDSFAERIMLYKTFILVEEIMDFLSDYQYAHLIVNWDCIDDDGEDEFTDINDIDGWEDLD